MSSVETRQYKSRMEGYAIGRQNGWLNANDIRELENMNPIPDEEGGNAYLVNGNMIPISVAMQDHTLPASTPSMEKEDDAHGNEEGWRNEQQDGDHSE